MKQRLCVLGLTAGLFCSAAGAATSDWYLGGSYDGYDLNSASAPFAGLFVNNASGATNVTTTSAWLNGILAATSTGESAVVRVYWGATDGGTNRENWAYTNGFGSIPEGQALTTNVSVTSNTTYYYRFYATNAAGEGWAYASASFLTLGMPVLDTGLGALPVGAATATLHGNLALGGSADIYVYWGTNDGGTTNNNWGNTNSLGTRGMGSFDTPVSGLIPGTLYYYRCYGTNAYGAGWSDAAAFTTLVQEVNWVGGSYDGYDRRDEQPQMQSSKGAMLFIH